MSTRNSSERYEIEEWALGSAISGPWSPVDTVRLQPRLYFVSVWAGLTEEPWWIQLTDSSNRLCQ